MRLARPARLGLPFAAALLVACATAPQSSSSTHEESTGTASSDLRLFTIPISRASLLAADAAASNDTSLRGVTGFLSHFTGDAHILIRRQDLLTGKPAIADYFAKNPINGSLGWRYARGDVSALGDFGYTVGWAQIIGPQDETGNNAPVEWFVYSATWQRGTDAEWKITAFTKLDLTSAPAAPPADLLPLTSDGPVYPSLLGAAATAKKMFDTDAVFAKYSVAHGRQIGFDAYVDENAIAMNDPFFYGRSSIFASNAGEIPGAVLDWAPVFASASKSGDLGYTIGKYTSTTPQPDGTIATRYGKYLTVWRRLADGSFKWVLDGGNSSPTPTP